MPVNEGPTFNRANILRLVWPTEYESIALNPNGWLFGVTLENGPQGRGYMSGDFGITNHDCSQVFGTFYWEYAMSSAGMIFPKPLPNFNAADPYVVRRNARRDDEGPVLPVIVSVIGTW